MENSDVFNSFRINVPVPSHYFVILMSCKNSSVSLHMCEDWSETASFILPHRPDNTETCHVSDVCYSLSHLSFMLPESAVTNDQSLIPEIQTLRNFEC